MSDQIDDRVGDDGISDDVYAKLADLARELVLNFWAAIRVARYHSVENEAYFNAVERLLASFGAIADFQETISLVYARKDFYVNDVRVKSKESDFEFMGAFGEELKCHEIGGVLYPGVPSAKDITDFVVLFNEIEPANTETPYADMSKTLMSRCISNFSVQKYGGDDLVHMPALEKEIFVKQTYFRGIMIAQQVYEQARRRKRLSLKSVKRVVQNIVDTALDDAFDLMDLLLLLTEIKNWQGYLFNHAVNTSVLAVAFGKILGIGRLQLRTLGTAAFLADVGSALLPLSILDGREALDERQQKAMKEHPIKAVTLLSAYQHIDALVIESVISALNHHRGYKNTGYPDGMKDEVLLFSKVISLCDRYDAMTSARPWRTRAMTPLQALEEIASLAGTEIDPVLAKAFIGWMGTMPSGSVVLLPDGGMGLVVRPRSRLRERDSIRVQTMMEDAVGECLEFDDESLLESVEALDLDTRQRKMDALLAYNPASVLKS